MTLKTKIIPFTVLTIGFILGASALSSLAAIDVPLDPPSCNEALYPGCITPINTGSSTQIKTGILKLNADKGDGTSFVYGLEVLNGIKLIDGAPNPDGMVLTSDISGVGNWKALPAGSGSPKYNKVTNEVSVQSKNGAGTMKGIIAPATTQWPVCVLTQNKFSGNNAFNNSCDINIDSGNWILNAYANAGGTESTYCSARCIGYSVVPTHTVSCTPNKSTYDKYETVTWTTTATGGGNFTYKYRDQSVATNNNTYTTSFNTAGTYNTWVEVFSNNLSVGRTTCGNVTVQEFVATCTTPKATVLRYEPMTWTATPAVAGTYLYKFSDQGSPSSSDTYTLTPSAASTNYSQTVTIYDSTGTNVMNVITCTNLENNTAGVAIPLIRSAIRDTNSTSSSVCPVTAFSESAPDAQRTLRGDYFGSYGTSPTWFNGNVQLGTGSQYILTLPASVNPYTIKHRRAVGFNFGNPDYTNGIISCDIKIDP
jgi:hypothetical protein